ncbi:MAG: DUF1552 domain-containing protein [Acidobacteriia bacterium]|nr:DUF1552 domain-containing protein [Terriglobia bacterium]
MNYITKKSLPRRTLLKGLGAGIALPMLDAMLPALAAKAASAPPRLGFVYVSHGIIFSQWKPQQTGRNFELSPNLQPLAPVRDQVNIFTNLSHLEADTKGDGSGDHNRAAAAWLTGVHAYDRTRPGAEIRLAPSIDQIAAKHLGRDTPVPSMEVTTDPPSQGACDSGDCFYVNTVSWRSETSPNAPELHPRVVFERLFGDGGSAEQRRPRMHESGSILDSVLEETSQITARLGSADSAKLDEYLGSIRDVEQRIQAAETHTEESLELPDRPVGIPATFEEHCSLMFDLQLTAFRADVTRVFSLIMARELSGRSYANIGVPGNHHLISHHREDPVLVSQKARIDTYHVQLLAKFLEKMHATPDGDGSLLDHSVILYGSGMGNGNLHRHSDLPVLAAGKLNGKFQTGYHFDYKTDTPMANLLVTILDNVGVPIEKVGDSTGQLLLDYSKV